MFHNTAANTLKIWKLVARYKTVLRKPAGLCKLKYVESNWDSLNIFSDQYDTASCMEEDNNTTNLFEFKIKLAWSVLTHVFVNSICEHIMLKDKTMKNFRTDQFSTGWRKTLVIKKVIMIVQVQKKNIQVMGLWI